MDGENVTFICICPRKRGMTGNWIACFTDSMYRAAPSAMEESALTL